MYIKSQSLLRELVKANIVWASVGSFILAFLLNLIQVRELFILKDAIFYLSIPFIFLLIRSYSFLKFFFFISVFCIYIITVTVIFYELKGWQLYNIRQLVAPLLILSISYSLKFSNENVNEIISYSYRLISIIIIAGMAFLLFDLWSYISLKNYFLVKGIPVDATGVSYMFYEPALGYARRLVSTFLDPINLGHTIAAFFIMAYYKVEIGGRRRVFYLILLLSGLLMTFSKGAILQVVLALFFFNKDINIINRALIPGLFVLAVLLFIDLKGILIHLHGLTNAIININLIGHGLGMVGNYAKMFADDLTVYHELQISDTYIGSVLGQIGIFGLLLWLAFFYKHLASIFLNKKNNVGSIIIVSQLTLAVLSENTLNFTSFLIPGLLAGVVYNLQKNSTSSNARFRNN